jgi:hypothetical protein
MSGSILPVTIYKNKLYFLFGKERDIDENPGWSDFGGGKENNETHIETATREGVEELTGFLGDKKTIHQMLYKYGTYNIDYKSKGYDIYRCHIFPMPYNPYLPLYYNNNQLFLQKKLDPKIIRDTKIFEKTQIKWFSLQDIKKNKSKFRKFYRNIIELILSKKEDIELFVKRSLKVEKAEKDKSKKRRYKKSFTKKRK